jgi:Adenosylmethionine-8-amino-7-oxononanoate aminotransferase
MKMGWKVAELAMEDEVLIRPLGNVVALMPPIEIEIEDLRKHLRVTHKAIKKATKDF